MTIGAQFIPFGVFSTLLLLVWMRKRRFTLSVAVFLVWSVGLGSAVLQAANPYFGFSFVDREAQVGLTAGFLILGIPLFWCDDTPADFGETIAVPSSSQYRMIGIGLLLLSLLGALNAFSTLPYFFKFLSSGMSKGDFSISYMDHMTLLPTLSMACCPLALLWGLFGCFLLKEKFGIILLLCGLAPLINKISFGGRSAIVSFTITVCCAIFYFLPFLNARRRRKILISAGICLGLIAIPFLVISMQRTKVEQENMLFDYFSQGAYFFNQTYDLFHHQQLTSFGGDFCFPAFRKLLCILTLQPYENSVSDFLSLQYVNDNFKSYDINHGVFKTIFGPIVMDFPNYWLLAVSAFPLFFFLLRRWSTRNLAAHAILVISYCSLAIFSLVGYAYHNNYELIFLLVFIIFLGRMKWTETIMEKNPSPVQPRVNKISQIPQNTETDGKVLTSE